MSLKVGEKAPLFDLPSTDGKIFSLKEHLRKPLILYFYPRDFTAGCIKEACSFRDQWNTFNDLNVDILGISTDTIERHHQFREHFKIPFHLLSDPQGTTCKLYSAWIPFLNMTKRVTYVLDKDLTISGAFSSMIQAKKHVEFALGIFEGE